MATKEIMQGAMPGARRPGRPHLTWIEKKDVDRTLCGGVSQNERIEINGESKSMLWPTLGLRTAKEQNRTEQGELWPTFPAATVFRNGYLAHFLWERNEICAH